MPGHLASRWHACEEEWADHLTSPGECSEPTGVHTQSYQDMA